MMAITWLSLLGLILVPPAGWTLGASILCSRRGSAPAPGFG